MKIKLFVLFLLPAIISIQCSSNNKDSLEIQKVNENDRVCKTKENRYELKIKPFKKFKDSLTLTLNVTKSHCGIITYLDTVNVSERIKDESSIIQVSEKVGIRVCIGRVRVNGIKTYICNLHLFKKEKDCWRDMPPTDNWEKFNLGHVTSGHSYGDYGTQGAIGFIGELKIE